LKKIAFSLLYLFCGAFFLFGFRYFGIGNSLLFEQILMSCLLSSVVFLLKPIRRSGKEVFSQDIFKEISIISLLFVLLMSFSVVNIDRSRSFYVLSWVGNGKVTCIDSGFDLSQVQSEEKLSALAIASRMEEQIQRGLILKSDEGCRLSNLGKLYLFFAETFSRVYFLRNWFENRI
jgi:hypothetical protein